uniref:Clathrin_bdg domain-containing protein n=1 Tax=Schistocephalus solidus TaxID=70667 RepID=A0A183T978_SCHSO
LPEPTKFLSAQSPSLLNARESFLFSNQLTRSPLPLFQLPSDPAPFFSSQPDGLNQYNHQHESSSPSVSTLPMKTEMSSWMSPISFLPQTAPNSSERQVLTLPTFEYPFAESEISRYMATTETFSQPPPTSEMDFSAFHATDTVFRQQQQQHPSAAAAAPPPPQQFHGENWGMKPEANSAFAGEDFSDRSFPHWEVMQPDVRSLSQLDDGQNREMATTAHAVTDSCSPKTIQQSGDGGLGGETCAIGNFVFFQPGESSLSSANYTQAQISPYGVENVQSTDASDARPSGASAQHLSLPTSLTASHLRQELEQPFLGMLLSLDQGNRQQPIGVSPSNHLPPDLSVEGLDCSGEAATNTGLRLTGMTSGAPLGSGDDDDDASGGCQLDTSQEGYWKGHQPAEEEGEEVKSHRLPSMEQMSQDTCQPVYDDLRTDWFSRSTAWKTVGSS